MEYQDFATCGNCAHWDTSAGFTRQHTHLGFSHQVAYGICTCTGVTLADIPGALALTNADAQCDDYGDGFEMTARARAEWDDLCQDMIDLATDLSYRPALRREQVRP